MQPLMIEVFRTNVPDPASARNMIFALHGIYPDAGVTFDLEDVDKVLRIESAIVEESKVISLMEAAGYSCRILP